MFELRLSYKEGILDILYLRCINCKVETGLYLKINSLVFDEIITKFVLNEILHHVGMSWIISSGKEINYEMEKNNHQDWLNKVLGTIHPYFSSCMEVRLRILLQRQEHTDII